MESKQALDYLHRLSLIPIKSKSKEELFRRKLRNIVEKDLDRLEKLDKAIEIIKEKLIDIELLIKSKTIDEYNEFGEYNEFIDYWNKLEKEEYELLKEVFG
jgi:hypothetical protein